MKKSFTRHPRNPGFTQQVKKLDLNKKWWLHHRMVDLKLRSPEAKLPRRRKVVKRRRMYHRRSPLLTLRMLKAQQQISRQNWKVEKRMEGRWPCQ